MYYYLVDHFFSGVLLLLLLLYSFETFLHQRLLMLFHRSLRDSKSLKVSLTFLSILANLNNVVVCMVSPPPPFSYFQVSIPILLVTVPRAPIIIGITVTFMFHSFFSSLARSRHLPPLFVFFLFYGVVSQNDQVRQVLFLIFIFC